MGGEGRSLSVHSLGELLAGPRASSVGVYGVSGHDLACLAGAVVRAAVEAGRPASQVVRFGFSPGASAADRLVELDLVLLGATRPGLVVVDEPDSDLEFLDAVPVVDAVVGEVTRRGAGLVFTTRALGQAVVADRCLRLRGARLRRIL